MAAAAAEPDEPVAQLGGVPHDRPAEAPACRWHRREPASTALAQRLQQTHPAVRIAASGINPVPLQEQQVGEMKPALLMLLGAVGFVLLIACVNIANLLLVARDGARARNRGAARARRRSAAHHPATAHREPAAGDHRRRDWARCSVSWGVAALKAMAPAGTPRIADVGIDARVLVFATVLSLATGVLFGLVPALHAARDRFTRRV